MSVESFFKPEEKQKIISSIKQAELDTSGEIRVHIENHCKGDVLDKASSIFSALKMHKTQLRNGVLIYLAIKDRRFAIIGDVGINKKVEPDFWDKTKLLMLKEFTDGRFSDGLVKGIRSAGERLKEFFPYQSDDINELSDEISFGKD